MKAVSLQDSLLFEFKNRIIGECLRNGRLKTANPCRKGFAVFYVRPVWAQSNRWKSVTHPGSGKCIAKSYTEKRLIPIFTKESPNTSCSKEYFGIIFIHLSWSAIQKIRDNIFLVRIYLSHFWRFWLPGSHLAIKNKNFVLVDWNKKNLIPNFCRLATICKKKSYPEFLNGESRFSRISEENSV